MSFYNFMMLMEQDPKPIGNIQSPGQPGGTVQGDASPGDPTAKGMAPPPDMSKDTPDMGNPLGGDDNKDDKPAPNVEVPTLNAWDILDKYIADHSPKNKDKEKK